MAHLICSCGKDMVMIKAGIGVDYGNGHVYPGDLLACKACGIYIVNTIGRAVPDKNYNQHDWYIRGTSHRIEFNQACQAPLEKLLNLRSTNFV